MNSVALLRSAVSFNRSASSGGIFRARVKAGRALALFSRDAQFQLGSQIEARGSARVLKLGAREWPLQF